MATGIPCPNPTCTHVFALEAVKGAAALVCPRCTTRFQFREGSASANLPRLTAPAIPLGKPLVPSVPPNPLTTPAAAAPLLLPRGKRSGWPNLQRVAVLGVVLAAVSAAIGGGIWILKHPAALEQDDATAAHESAHNYRLAYPNGWKSDAKTRLALGANLVLTRPEPSSWLALFAQDYKTRSPRPAELHDRAVTWLEKYFLGFEFEDKPDEPLDGEPARRLDFQGEVDNVLMNGECLMLSRRGYGYWLVTWAPAERRDAADREWPALRGGFHFLNGREGWTEKNPRQIPFHSDQPAYRLTYTEGIWEKLPLDGPDPDVQLLLRGFDPKDEARLADRAGLVTVFKLPRGQGGPAAAAAAARQHLANQQKEAYPDTRIEAVNEKASAGEVEAPIGAARGRLARLRVHNSDARELYVELATVVIGDTVVVIQCECLWPRRAYWRQEFTALRETFRLGKGK